MRQARAVVVALGREKYLRLMLEPPERAGVDDPVAVALERRARRILVLEARASPALVGERRARGEDLMLNGAGAGPDGVVQDLCPLLRGNVLLIIYTTFFLFILQKFYFERKKGSGKNFSEPFFGNYMYLLR